MSQQPTAKVLFRVPGEDGEATVETLWAIPLGDDLYKLDNSPFYAYGVSWQDVVLAPYDEQEGFATFHSVVEKSGHRTIRILFDAPLEAGNPSDRVLKALLDLGCTYEGANRAYLSIDIPPRIDLQSVRDYLIGQDVQWEHANPTYDELYPSSAEYDD